MEPCSALQILARLHSTRKPAAHSSGFQAYFACMHKICADACVYVYHRVYVFQFLVQPIQLIPKVPFPKGAAPVRSRARRMLLAPPVHVLACSSELIKSACLKCTACGATPVHVWVCPTYCCTPLLLACSLHSQDATPIQRLAHCALFISLTLFRSGLHACLPRPPRNFTLYFWTF